MRPSGRNDVCPSPHEDTLINKKQNAGAIVPANSFFFSLLYPVAYNISLIYSNSIYILFMWNRSSKSNLTMMIISDLLAVAMLIIVIY